MTYADLERVDYKYLLCGLSDGGVAIYDTTLVKDGFVYGEVGSIKGGHRGTHKYQVQFSMKSDIYFIQYYIKLLCFKGSC